MNPDRVVPGQVVSSDIEDGDGQVRPQETFLHKVASGPVSDSMTGRHSRAGWNNGTSTNGDGVYGTSAPGTGTDYAADAKYAGGDAAIDDTEVMAPTEVAADDDAAVAEAEAEDGVAGVAGGEYTSTADPYTAADPYTTDNSYTADDPYTADGTEVPDSVDATAGVDAMDSMDAMDVANTTPDVPAVPPPADQDADEPLLGAAAGRIQEEWRAAQGSFVDDPHASVVMAAGVVADAAARLESLLRERQRNLRGGWDGNGKADTETLRQSLLTYRRLLAKLIS